MPKAKHYLYHSKFWTIQELQKLAEKEYQIKISRRGLGKRLAKHWTVHRAISTPLRDPMNGIPTSFEFRGRLYTRQELLEQFEANCGQLSIDLITALVAANLAHLMQAHHTTRTQLAHFLNTNNYRVNLYLAGQRTPNIVTLIRLADHYQVSLDYFITGHE